MNHPAKTVCTFAFSICLATGALAQGTSTGGAPPATHSSNSDSGSGRSAGIKGGAGAAGEYGTDPATLKKEETARQQRDKANKAGTGVSK